MGIQQFDPKNYRLDYVPQRLAALDVCVLACHSVLSSRVSDPLELNFGSSKLSLPDSNLLIGIAIDAGLLANRTLLNFLGIKLSNGSLVNESYALTIEKFSLQLVPLADACKVLEPMIPAAEMLNIWVEALNTASKSAAHFTDAGATIRVARLGFACYATSKLVRRYFFDATRTPGPDSLVSLEVEPRFGGVWDSVDPTLNVLL